MSNHGRILKMEKNNQPQKNEHSNHMFRKRGGDEVLEISSTGYGFESATKKPEESEGAKRNNPSGSSI